MLEEGQQLRSIGADVVVGFVEPHGRRPTAALVEGLETIPRRSMTHRGAAFTEMDLDAVLACRPQVALVDELAHTNVPGSRNTKRWQDVEELLDAGTDVVTTLNVQHLESLGDVVRQITGVPQRETLPDEVARRADQIELVDLEPELLRRRMLHGEIYPSDRVEAALTHYFRVGNLTALRELALLWLADRVEEGLQRYRAEHGITAPWETRERIMVALTGGPEGETLIRRAARVTARTPGSELLALHVVPSDGLVHADPAALTAQRALVESLGGSYHQTSGEDLPATLVQFAEAENVTQIVLGASRRGRLSTFLYGSVGHRTIRRSGPIDVLVVTHEHAAGESSPLRLPHPTRATGPRRFWAAMLMTAVALPALTLLLAALRDDVELAFVLVLYLLTIVVIALVGGLVPALLAALAAGLLADYYFTAPLHSLHVERTSDVLALVVFVVTAVVVGMASGTAARRTYEAVRARSEARALSRLAAALMHGEGLASLLEQVREDFGLDAVSLLAEDTEHPAAPRWHMVAGAGEDPPERPYDADVESPAADGLILAARGRSLSSDDRLVLEACAAQLVMAHVHGRLAAVAAETGLRAEAEHTRASLLLAASRDLRAPLRTADEALHRLSSLPAGPDSRPPVREVERFLATARSSVRRAVQLVTDLDDLSRLHAESLDMYPRPVDLDEVLTAVLDILGPGSQRIRCSLPEQLPDVIADAAVLTRVLAALAAEALRHAPPERPADLTAETGPGRLAILVTDGTTGDADGVVSGKQEGRTTDSVILRLSRDLAEAMGGTLAPVAALPGFAMVLTLPTAGPLASRKPA
ncbi:sensor histidine kinase [Streptomyces gardneri]|uniref:histidine kinase n=2 Tax=Streptomyces gardneri TaxID=66892 RepID=A0A4Y3RCM6_9ACTN|nr:sensor histidine kinase [Streptomyces gardneri]